MRQQRKSQKGLRKSQKGLRKSRNTKKPIKHLRNRKSKKVLKKSRSKRGKGFGIARRDGFVPTKSKIPTTIVRANPTKQQFQINPKSLPPNPYVPPPSPAPAHSKFPDFPPTKKVTQGTKKLRALAKSLPDSDKKQLPLRSATIDLKGKLGLL